MIYMDVFTSIIISKATGLHRVLEGNLSMSEMILKVVLTEMKIICDFVPIESDKGAKVYSCLALMI